MNDSYKQIVIVPFSKVGEVEKELVGSKGANLGKLLMLRTPVPNGFIITTHAFEQHLGRNNLYDFIQKELSDIDPSDSVRLENASKRIRSGILKVGLDKELQTTISKAYASLSGFTDTYVAVRSSSPLEDLKKGSTQFSTFLNVRGKEDVLEKVKSCWVSLFSPQNLFYILSRGTNLSQLKMAVIVQKMVQAEVSGIMFTLNPIDNDNSKMSIEAVLGLGEVLVHGQVTPDSYLVNKDSGEIIEKHIVPQDWMLVRKGRAKRGEDPNVKVKVSSVWKTKQKLENKYIKGLVKIGKILEKQFGEAQDIEWAYEGGKIWIVQSRPVVNLEIEEESWKKTPTLAALKSKVGISRKREEEKVERPSQVRMEERGKQEVLLSGNAIHKGLVSGKVIVASSPKHLQLRYKRIVLVVPNLTSEYESNLKNVVAVVVDDGGREQYTSTLCAKLDIPCITDTQIASKILRSGEFVTVNGETGEVLAGTCDEGILEAEKILQVRGKMRKAGKESIKGGKIEKEEEKKDSITKPQLRTATKIFVNLDDPNLAPNVAMKHVEGVVMDGAGGILKEAGMHPQLALKRRGGRDQIIRAIALGLYRVAKSFEPRPVVYKLCDMLSRDYLALQGGSEFEVNEENPLLGLRGASRFISNPEEVGLELEAVRFVRNKENIKNIWVSIPYVRTYKELREMKHIISAAKFRRSTTFKIFAAVEVPAAAIRIEKFLDLGIDGVIIDIDELAQGILGIDKSNPKLVDNYKDSHPAVLWAVERVVKACSKANVHSQIKGRLLVANPGIIKKFVKWGVTSISVSSDMEEQMREFIAEAEGALLTRRKR